MWTATAIDLDKPLYLAVLEAIERDIRSGLLRPGQRMPTHRRLAEQIGSTLSMASRIYREAEKRELLNGEVGRGTFVAANADKKASMTSARGNIIWDMGMSGPLPQAEPLFWPIVRKVLHRRRLSDLMAYPDPRGLTDHRGVGSDWVSRFGLNVRSNGIVITAGARHALFTICNSLFKPGDSIATDCLSHPGINVVAQRNGLRLEGVPMDSAGMVPNALGSLCNRRRIKGVYISGRIQNPTNREMPRARRLELGEIIRRQGLLVIENDPCGFLSDARDKTISALVPERSVYISCLSNVFLTGLRIAYAAAAPAVARRLGQGVASSMVAVSPLCAEIASACITSGVADLAIAQKREALANRLELFRKVFAGNAFTVSNQSMFAWLSLPPRWKGAELEREAARHGIRVFGAEKFIVGSTSAPKAVRISLTGVERLITLKKALRSLERLVAKPD